MSRVEPKHHTNNLTEKLANSCGLVYSLSRDDLITSDQCNSTDLMTQETPSVLCSSLKQY